MCAMVAERAAAPPAVTLPPAAPIVRVGSLNHYYGEGEARNQVLFGNSIEIPAAQLVVMTGPSGAQMMPTSWTTWSRVPVLWATSVG